MITVKSIIFQNYSHQNLDNLDMIARKSTNNNPPFKNQYVNLCKQVQT